MDKETLNRIEERLTRLEAGLAQGATAAAVGPGSGPGPMGAVKKPRMSSWPSESATCSTPIALITHELRVVA